MALHGVEGLEVGDIDILTGPGDARRVLAAKGTAPFNEDRTSRFRSDVYGAWPCGAYRIEVMAGFAVLTEGRWVAVQPASRIAVEIPRDPVFVPGVQDLIAMCDLFRRPKDGARKTLLQALVRGR